MQANNLRPDTIRVPLESISQWRRRARKAVRAIAFWFGIAVACIALLALPELLQTAGPVVVQH